MFVYHGGSSWRRGAAAMASGEVERNSSHDFRRRVDGVEAGAIIEHGGIVEMI